MPLNQRSYDLTCEANGFDNLFFDITLSNFDDVHCLHYWRSHQCHACKVEGKIKVKKYKNYALRKKTNYNSDIIIAFV